MSPLEMVEKGNMQNKHVETTMVTVIDTSINEKMLIYNLKKGPSVCRQCCNTNDNCALEFLKYGKTESKDAWSASLLLPSN